MTDRKEALIDLLKKVEMGNWDAAGWSWVLNFNDNHRNQAKRAFLGSLDAAKGLHEAVLPNWVVDDLSQNGTLVGHPWGIRIAYWNASDPSKNKFEVAGWGRDTVPDDSPARAWLIAILKALIAKEGEA